MSGFSHGIWFEIEECCNCGMAFAMSNDFHQRRKKDHKTFYCPAGHAQHYVGKTEEQKLKDELAKKQRQLEAETSRAATFRNQRDKVAKAHKKMRERVKNGVCPCCNRSFENLRRHMESQHPEFGNHEILKVLRDAFGLTQSALAEEIGMSAAAISNYERGNKVGDWTSRNIESWITENS